MLHYYNLPAICMLKCDQKSQMSKKMFFRVCEMVIYCNALFTSIFPHKKSQIAIYL